MTKILDGATAETKAALAELNAKGKLGDRLWQFWQIVYEHGNCSRLETAVYFIETGTAEQQADHNWTWAIKRDSSAIFSALRRKGLQRRLMQRRCLVSGQTVWVQYCTNRTVPLKTGKGPEGLDENDDGQTHWLPATEIALPYATARSIQKLIQDKTGIKIVLQRCTASNPVHADSLTLSTAELALCPKPTKDAILAYFTQKHRVDETCSSPVSETEKINFDFTRALKALANVPDGSGHGHRGNMHAYVCAKLAEKPELIDIALGTDSTLKLTPFFPGLQAESVERLSSAGYYVPESWKIIASKGALQTGVIPEMITFGYVRTNSERWQERQPFPVEPTSRLNRFCGTDDEGLAAASFIFGINNAARACSITGQPFTSPDPAVSKMRQELLWRTCSLVQTFKDSWRLTSLFQALAFEPVWTGMFDGYTSMVAPWTTSCAAPQVQLNLARYPVNQVTGTDAEGDHIVSLLIRFTTSFAYFARTGQPFTTSGDEALNSVRTKLLQYFCRVFSSEIQDRSRWVSVLTRLAQEPDWTDLLEPAAAVAIPT